MHACVQVTEDHRQQVEIRNREREKRAAAHDLCTDRNPIVAINNRLAGKMDHATCACYQVGKRKPH